MIAKTEKNRIIRLKRSANYLRSRSENDELTKKQMTLAMANANATSWTIELTIQALKQRERQYVRDSFIDPIIKFLNRLKFKRNTYQYERIDEEIQELYTLDIMDHEKIYDGQAKILEHNEAVRGSQETD